MVLLFGAAAGALVVRKRFQKKRDRDTTED